MKSVLRGSLLLDAVCVVRPNEFSPFWSLMSTSTISSTSTLKGWFLVSLVSNVATHRYVSVTKGWVTPLFVWVVSDGMITILQNKTESLNILYTIVLKLTLCIYFLLCLFCSISLPVFCKVSIEVLGLGKQELDELRALADTGIALHQFTAVFVQSLQSEHRLTGTPLLHVFPHSCCCKCIFFLLLLNNECLNLYRFKGKLAEYLPLNLGTILPDLLMGFEGNFFLSCLYRNKHAYVILLNWSQHIYSIYTVK